jgi:hypothetical protein
MPPLRQTAAVAARAPSTGLGRGVRSFRRERLPQPSVTAERRRSQVPREARAVRRSCHHALITRAARSDAFPSQNSGTDPRLP